MTGRRAANGRQLYRDALMFTSGRRVAGEGTLADVAESVDALTRAVLALTAATLAAGGITAGSWVDTVEGWEP